MKIESFRSTSSDKENVPRPKNQYKSAKEPSDSSSLFISSPRVTKTSITQEYYQSYSPVRETITTKPFPSFSCPTPQRSEYLPLEIQDEDDLQVFEQLEDKLHQHQSKNFGFTAFVGINILFILVVTVLIYLMHTNPSTLGKSDHHNANQGFSVEVDGLTNRYFVIDHNPSPNFPFMMTEEEKAKMKDANVDVTNRVILADGLYHRNLNNNGWNYLSIETMDLKSFASRLNLTQGHLLSEDEQLSMIRDQYTKNRKALGYLEGYLTCNEIKQFYENFYADTFTNMNLTREAVDFLLLNYQWMSLQSEQYSSYSNYWLVVKGLLAQLNGMVEGVRDGCPVLGNDYSLHIPSVQEEEEKEEESRRTVGGTGKRTAKASKSAFSDANSASLTFQTVLTPEDYANDDYHYNNVFLPSMHKHPELIHFLLVNANGDLFQIKQKYDIIERDPISVSNDDIDRADDDDDQSGIAIAEDPTLATTTTTTTTSTTATPIIPPPINPVEGQSLLSEASIQRHLREIDSFLPRAEVEKKKKKNQKISSHSSLRHRHYSLASGAKDPMQQRRQLAYKIQQVINSNHDPLSSINKKQKKNPHHDHCSAIIKLLPNASDIVFGHNTWDDFTNAAPRIFKHYTYTLLQESRPNKRFNVYFSSSPGLLGSVDDFYIVHGYGHLAVLETSLDINNDQLLNIVSPETMLYWTRASISNQLAHSGKSWAQIFSMHHSGTYANQWMILDYQKFTPGALPKANFLTILEEVPGYIHYDDMTAKFIADGYWASYNNPYFDDIARITGQYTLCQQDATNCYTTDPRAEIFRAHQQEVKNVTDLKFLMTYNDYQHDPFAAGNPCNAISCRSDLDPDVRKRSPFGAVDSKISSVVLSAKTDYEKNKPTIYIQLGPTHTQQTPFCWSSYEQQLATDIALYNQQNPLKPMNLPSYNHNGHPDCFNFTWEKLPPVVMP